MNPLDLTPDQHAALYAAARDRAHALRRQAIAGAVGAAKLWLRRRLAVPATPRELACRS